LVQPEQTSDLRSFVREFKGHRLAVFGIAIILTTIGMAMLAPLISPHDPDAILWLRLQPPSSTNVLGTDELGRDVLSRLIWGAQLTLLIGVLSAVLASLLGVLLGALAGYVRPVDFLIMKVCEIFLVIPSFFLYITVASVLRSRSPYLIIMLLGVTMWPTVARIVRSEFLSIRERGFVVAATAAGSGAGHIILHHMLPNTMASIIVTTTMNISSAILVASALSFLGLGDPTAVEWGNMLQYGGRVMQQAWWLAFFPGIAIFLVSLAFNLVGDGMRDALDPRLRSA
jgi:peptide/nickel transport system permease protein